MVASVLGRKYGVKVVIGGRGAYTDGSTIHLPALPLESSETLIGLARGYIDHEAAHIRETRFDWLCLANLTPLEMHVWNTFEDWRVEHRLARLFPGCRQNFNWLIKHLFGNPSEKTADPAMAILNWLLLSVRAWDVPSLNGQRDAVGSFVEAHYPGLTTHLNSVLKKVNAYCDSTQDCILYAREVVSILKAKAAILPPQNEASSEGKATKKDTPGRLPSEALKRLINTDEADLPDNMGEALADNLIREIPKDLSDANSRAAPIVRAHANEGWQAWSAGRATTTSTFGGRCSRIQTEWKTCWYQHCCSHPAGLLRLHETTYPVDNTGVPCSRHGPRCNRRNQRGSNSLSGRQTG